jgi:moderate conductance mechanosensitive channel
MLSPKTWWLKKSRNDKINFVCLVVFYLVSLVFVVLMLLATKLWPDADLGRCILTNRTLVGTWDDIWPRIVGMVFYLCLFVDAFLLLQFILRRLFITSKKAATVIKLIGSFIKYALALALIFIWVAIWGVDTGALLISAGIIALVIGLGAQSLISDIIAGLNIVFEEEFKVGDIVVVDDFRGTIQEIGLTTTKILDPAGNVKIINNSQISTVVNLSDHPSVAACLMYIDYDEDLVRIEKLLNDNAPSLKSQIPGALDVPKYIGVSALQDGYIELKIICHCKEEDRFQTERDLNRAYCLLFLNNGVDYPYNQLMLGSRALTHPQDAADPEQLKRILAHLAGDDMKKDEVKKDPVDK